MSGVVCGLLLSLAAGGGLLADSLIFTDPSTGFSTDGSVWIRYGALALLTLIFLFLARPGTAAQGRQNERSPFLAGVFGMQAMAFFAGFALALAQIAAQTSAAGGLFDRYTGERTFDLAAVLLAVGWLAGGFWCGWIAVGFVRGTKQPAGTLLLGIITTIACFVLCARRFVFSPTSIQRVTPTLDLISALTAMLLCCGLLRQLYLPAEEHQPKRLCFFGLTAFLFDFCVVGAKQVARLSLGQSVLEEIGDLPLLFLGLLGAAVAIETLRMNPRQRPAHFSKE